MILGNETQVLLVVDWKIGVFTQLSTAEELVGKIKIYPA
jgi:hypothetical protein